MNQADARRTLARRSPHAIRFFERQFGRELKGSFNSVRLSLAGCVPVLPDMPIVLYTNHSSWWDAVTYFFLGRTLFRERRGFGPIDETQLRRYPMLDRLGLFGIDLYSYRGAKRFLSLARELFTTSDTMMWLAAEGRFTDPRTRPIRLRPGISHLAAIAPCIGFVPVAIEYRFWDQKRPELLVRFGEVVTSEAWRGRRKALQEHLENSLGETLDLLQAESATRDPALFKLLLEGKTGISFFYDVGCRLKALASGKRYSGRHQ